MYFFISTSPRKIAIVMYNIVVAVIACKQQHKRGVEARRRRRDEATIGHGGGGVSGRAASGRGEMLPEAPHLSDCLALRSVPLSHHSSFVTIYLLQKRMLLKRIRKIYFKKNPS
jgi:hypothetical protein